MTRPTRAMDQTAITPPGDPAVWEQLDQVFGENHRFLLTTHINPDGDGLGSEIALGLHLAAQGKDVCILNAAPIPQQFRFLQSETARVEVYDDQINRQRVLTSDVVVILDTAEWSRLGRMQEVVKQARGKLAVIDHHICLTDIGDVFLSVPGASSTGELIYYFLRRHTGQLNRDISRALFVALATDTGWFRFDNTSADVLRIAGELIDNGVFPPEIYRAVYENTTWDDVKLSQELVARMRPECDAKVVTICLDEPLYRRCVGRDAVTDRLLDYALSIPETEVVLLFKQLGKKLTKLSLRSRGIVDVGLVARNNGGGGHRNASGVLAEIAMPAFEATILEQIGQALTQSGEF